MSTTPESGENYRARVRAWLAEHAVFSPEEMSPEEQHAAGRRWQRSLAEGGYAGITWPTEYGGQGLGTAEQQIFDEEAMAYELPGHAFMITLGMIAPTLIDLGTEEQKLRYLPQLLNGTELWCQLFSEPGAGSDIAGLQTKAVREGDEWVLNGQKVWTSRAHWADYGAILARTNPDVPKHQGITMFIVSMKAPGVTVRPLKVMTGESPFNEVFFDNVRIPADAVIGEVDAGWTSAVTMLGHERVSLGSRRPPVTNSLSHESITALARRVGSEHEEGVRLELADFYAHERALALLITRLRQETAAGIKSGARGSITKLTGAMQQRRAVDLISAISGAALTAWDSDDDATRDVNFLVNLSPAPGIAGGTSEIQRNIIGERLLGLPKEHDPSKGKPFRVLQVGTQTGAQV